MVRRLIRLAKGLSITVVSVVGVVAAYFYTRPVPISANSPPKDNARLRDKLLSVKKAIFIGAHPDDIEFYCGGLVGMMREKGVEVTFAIGTRGGKGRTGAAKTRLEGLRSAHQLDAARILGGVSVVLYHYPDKSLPSFVEPFAGDLRSLIARLKPDIIFSWDPDFIYNPHPDHQAAADAARIATEDARARVVYYGTRKPNVWVGYGKDVFAVKLRALRSHRTETPWYFFPFGKRFLVRKSNGEGAKTGATYAEVFRELVPETGH